jgi:multiple sugar transport system permease protein
VTTLLSPVDTAPAVDTARRPSGPRRIGLLPTAVLMLGVVYCLVPVVWVLVAASKSRTDLFDTSTFAPGWSLLENIGDLSAYRDGLFWRWMANTALYAGVGAALSAFVSGLSGYTLSKFRFPGKALVFNTLLAGVLMPAIVLAIPQYLLLAKLGLAGTYWSVLLPSIISPYGIYLSRVYADAAIPDSLVEAARTDGATEFRVFLSVALPIMRPGLVTVFLFQFVAVWNNFMLPFVMLSDDEKFPLTVGLHTLLAQGADQPSLYSQVIAGALLSIVPLVALFLSLQRYWRVDLISGSVKS